MPLFKLKYWILIGMLLPLALIVLALVRPNGPDYQVVERGDGFELRAYGPLRVAETRVEGDFAVVDERAYPHLLGYIRGENGGARKMPILAPALAQRTGEHAWLVQFVMAQEYPLSMLPQPTHPAVTVRELPQRLLAVRRSGGDWDPARWRQDAEGLMDAVVQAGLAPIGEPIFARYNAAFVPGVLRRNEVMLPVER
ncbi:heme-binding protein [uncultured Thiohalocapsa sp.]|uniref:SOUL family heme-binding protein n=1 Tax=uncultured Thiohalocapsa sp. TaxID=768990 RepID=UPI0025FA884C|nr:heme-binding protein [uncultured Thiohalocapsa sp.]